LPSNNKQRNRRNEGPGLYWRRKEERGDVRTRRRRGPEDEKIENKPEYNVIVRAKNHLADAGAKTVIEKKTGDKRKSGSLY